MKLRNKKTGEIATLTLSSNGEELLLMKNNEMVTRNVKLSDLEEWQDYEEPLLFFTRSIRDAIRAWWKLQENPFECANVLCINDRKDKDGFYNYHIYGYIREGENKIATEFQFRTKCYYEYEHLKDYTLEELCGGEE